MREKSGEENERKRDWVFAVCDLNENKTEEWREWIEEGKDCGCGFIRRERRRGCVWLE